MIKKMKEKDQQQAQIQQAQQQYEQTIQQQQMAMQEMQNQNINLKGSLEMGRSIHADLLSPEEKKIFDQNAKKAVLDSVMGVPDQTQAVNMEPNTANQNNQG
jgi:hypothetical protein